MTLSLEVGLSSDFAFEKVDSEGAHVVSLFGQLDLANAERVRDALVGVEADTVVVDLSGLRFLDSSGISALLVARKALAKSGCVLELRGAQGVVRRVLEVTGLAHLLTS